MTKILISELQNHIINVVRLTRLDLDITQTELSKQITPFSETNLVGLIESEQTTTTYNDNHLNIFAKYFSEQAKILAKEKIDYTVYDFYPNVALEERLIVKTVYPISKEMQATGLLNYLIETRQSYLDEWHTIKEITLYCNNFLTRNWKTTDFTAVIARAVDSGKLNRSSENDPKYKIA